MDEIQPDSKQTKQRLIVASEFCTKYPMRMRACIKPHVNYDKTKRKIGLKLLEGRQPWLCHQLFTFLNLNRAVYRDYCDERNITTPFLKIKTYV